MNERIKKVSANQIYFLTREQEEDIYVMFFGPYKPEWKDKKGIVDNSDSAIAKRMKLPVHVVSNSISRICNDHFDEIARLHKAK